ncbi:uncharacterized protein B0P05DRAFT_111732 [Gilbertella persicaria]|uniref:uncharacterized protein n=1 Tax=Gilbertella persicaria TaxID=101096 RepID=UPI00221F36A9|nr:uncharacterized protein B0P05DRAFT_111732 [Gilbertella persicaria]KAI8078153.1 hypothetical protein B0P05DRAFT_111732 [Gilbertella persicaria]
MDLPSKKRLRRTKKLQCQLEKRIDFVDSVFSKELVLKVFSFLSSSDLAQCAVVSLRWSQMASDEMLWKPLFMNQFEAQENITQKTTATRYGGSWKTKYRVHHNWLLGNHDIHDIVQYQDNTSPHQLQLMHDVLFISQQSSIDVYRTEGPVLLRQLQCTSCVTFLKLVESTHTHHLVAGDANGGLTLWEIKGSSSMDLDIVEIATYATEQNKVISVGMNYPILVTFTHNRKLSVFRLQNLTCSLIQCLQSPMDWSPMIMDIHAIANQRWKVVLCFGSSHHDTVGMQEIVLNLHRVISSRQGFCPLSFPCHSLSDQITSMVYDSPYLITAHTNNTMKQYIVSNRGSQLDIRFQQTLYGHTCRVDALAITKHKLISGDRSGIYIWNLATKQHIMTLRMYQDQSSLNELPDAHMETLGFDEDKIVAVVQNDKDGFI